MVTVGLALIAKNEQRTLPTLLASIHGAFDEVVLVDTGSTDRTVEIFQAWAATQPDGFTGRVDHFEWIDDFAAARNHADGLLTSEWRVWADCDDEIRGAENIRDVIARTPPEAVAVVADYAYAHDHAGNCVCTLKRERLVKAGKGRWIGRVHEAQTLDGPTVTVAADTLVWIHRKPPEQGAASSDRNLRILQAWHDEDPTDARVVAYLGTEHQAQGKHREAVDFFLGYLQLPQDWPEQDAQVRRKLSASLLALGEPDRAVEFALDGLRLLPSWTDSYLSLAQAAAVQGEHDKAIFWAHRTLELGMPESLLILNPLDYVVEPRAILCAAHSARGEWDEAVEAGRKALEVAPYAGHIREGVEFAERQRKREFTARSFLSCAHMLAAHDEQENALKVLEAVPHFALDHPMVVAERSRLRERIVTLSDPAGYAGFYRDGGDNKEAGVPDETLSMVCEQLPRAHFVHRGLAETLGMPEPPEPPRFEVVRTRVGPMRVRPGDLMRQELAGDFEADVREALERLVKPGMVVADVGANVGYFARVLADLVGPDGYVHAVEPDPQTARLLKLNVRDRPWVRVHEYAAGNDARQVRLTRHPLNSGESHLLGDQAYPGVQMAGHVTVPVYPLGVKLPALDVCVIDAQGHDPDVLEGFGSMRPPVVIVEHWPEGLRWAGFDPDHVLDAYRGWGYSVTPLDPSEVGSGHWNLLLERTPA